MVSFVNVATFFKRVITKEDLPYRKIVHNSYRKFVMLVIVSTIPTGIIGIAAKDLVSAAERFYWFLESALLLRQCFYLLQTGFRVAARHQSR